jgi:multidrug efflux pump subunit AcrB
MQTIRLYLIWSPIFPIGLMRMRANGVVDVIDDASETSPQISIRIDSAKARLLGITNAAIAQTLRTAVYGTTAVSFRQSDEEIDVVVSLTEKSRNDLETFNEIYLKSMGGFKTLFK